MKLRWPKVRWPGKGEPIPETPLQVFGIEIVPDISDEILLRCPECRKEIPTPRLPYDYPEAVRMEVLCGECWHGDHDEVMYYAADGRHIVRDPDTSTPEAHDDA